MKTFNDSLGKSEMVVTQKQFGVYQNLNLSMLLSIQRFKQRFFRQKIMNIVENSFQEIDLVGLEESGILFFLQKLTLKKKNFVLHLVAIQI